MIELTVNGEQRAVDAAPNTPLLWLLRDSLKLTGTKYGCGLGACGACTVHLDGVAVRSCLVTAEQAAGGEVLTIEGLSGGDGELHPVQRAWMDEGVPQCGYCQSGQIMTAAALLAETPRPSRAEIDTVMAPILCRCATYGRIRTAIERAAREEETR